MKNFEITFKWIGASTWVLNIDCIKIACDPILCDSGTIIDLKFFKSKRKTKPQFKNTDFENIDIWLLTHNHADHIDSSGMAKLSTDSRVLSHKNLKPWFANQNLENVYFMKWREKAYMKKNSYEIEVEAITCVHGSNLVSAILCGGVNGYWIKIIEGERNIEIYVTGDTINHPKVKKHIRGRKADILIPNIGGSGLNKFGGPFSYTSDLLVDTIKNTSPTIILPVHHKTFSMFKEPIQQLYNLNDDRIQKFDEGEIVII